MRVALCGLGRAGSELARALVDHPDIQLAAGFCRPRSIHVGMDIGEFANIPFTGVTACDVTEAYEVLAKHKIDVVIDFSSPVASKAILKACRSCGIGIVVCTTGFTIAEIRWMKFLASNREFGIVYAPNVTLGVNVLMSMVKIAAQKLPDYDFHVTEMHHRYKKDIPSATAKCIVNALENELHGYTDPVQIHSVRAGGYVGYHEVLIVGDYERILVVHESFSRRAFVEGALTAARFIKERRGFFQMDDVLVKVQKENQLAEMQLAFSTA
jgi:4-hydroxy-tetrahydrodipicolinate reductase